MVCAIHESTVSFHLYIKEEEVQLEKEINWERAECYDNQTIEFNHIDDRKTDCELL
jgi:hypothetical protein